ncbi:MAG TPA: hypothetical protein VLR48_13490 [Thiocapsa sp.]|nr:hypothetical protein [Thiocapsa sp.]
MKSLANMLVLGSLLGGMQASALAIDLVDVQQAIADRGAAWNPGETAFSRQTPEHIRRRLGLSLDGTPEPPNGSSSPMGRYSPRSSTGAPMAW